MAAQAPDVGDPVFVGRVRELDEIRSTIERARAGRMQALLVSGDAGVGKTRLVQQACAPTCADDPGLVVLSGACLPLGTMTVPLVPIRSALRSATADLHASPLSATGAGGPGGRGESLPEDAVQAVDEWLERVCRDRPVVLVVDDLQWADESTLDVLMYVVAGSLERRLAVVCTLRRGETGTGHPLQRWLADVRRMPCYAELTLAPLERGETREQVRSLLRASPHETLVEEVHARTGGNAYLNRLLVEDLPPDLGAAVLRPWHRLSEQTRELVRIIAVGGEVALGPSLARAARLASVPPSRPPDSCGRPLMPVSWTSTRAAATGSTIPCKPRRWRPAWRRRNSASCTPPSRPSASSTSRPSRAHRTTSRPPPTGARTAGGGQPTSATRPPAWLR